MRIRVCILGLGNPGPKYQGTRHNIGFDWVNSAVSQLFGATQWQEKYESAYCEQSAQWSGQEFDLHFLKPLTYMNESGRAFDRWKSKNQGESRFLVAYDDMDLPLGKLRLRNKGSDGGHRGMRSLIERGGTDEIPRLRIGIGRPEQDGKRDDTLNHVLERFDPSEKIIVERLLADAGEQLKILLTCTYEQAMNKINSKNFGDG